MSYLPWNWFIEYTGYSQAHIYGVRQSVYSGRSPYQAIDILDTEFFGRCLMLDGKMQSAEADEYIYHEALIHPAMTFHPEPKDVLIIGGAEGAALREIIKHPSVGRLMMIDIDKQVIEICHQYLPEWSNNVFKDPRVEILFRDARKYLEDNMKKWDIILIDLTEPLNDGPSYLLFTEEFYSTVFNRLKNGGIIALQAGNLNPMLLKCHGAIKNTLELIFNKVESYGAFIPSYNTVWGFIFASQEINALNYTPEIVDYRLEEELKISDLRFYDGRTHLHMFTLPKNTRRLLSEEKRIIKDDNPLFTQRGENRETM